jgi:anti-sigma factor RsiW
MNGHLDAWLDLYIDDELPSSQKKQAEAHLETCLQCRNLVAERRALSALLVEMPPASGLKPVDQFAAEVALRLERRQPQPPVNRPALRLVWQLVPMLLIMVWGFLQAVFLADGLVGIIPGAQQALSQPLALATSLLVPGLTVSQTAGDILSTSGIFSIVDWNWVTGIIALLLVGITYICWLASWWAVSGSQRQAGFK